jgi:hypothetical protein
MVAKAEFVVLLMRWINHKDLIQSRSKYLPSQAKREALRFVNEAFKPCRENSAAVPLQAVARLVLQCEPQLRLILPSVNNTAYQSSLSTLDKIIEHAKKLANTPTYPARIEQLEVVAQPTQNPRT